MIGVPIILFAFLVSSWKMNGKAEGRWLGTSPCDNEIIIALRTNALRAYERKSSELISPGPRSRVGTLPYIVHHPRCYFFRTILNFLHRFYHLRHVLRYPPCGRCPAKVKITETKLSPLGDGWIPFKNKTAHAFVADSGRPSTRVREYRNTWRPAFRRAKALRQALPTTVGQTCLRFRDQLPTVARQASNQAITSCFGVPQAPLAAVPGTNHAVCSC